MQELNCNQVMTLMTFFIEGKLSSKLMASVEYHLSICADCRQKYMKLKKILDNFSEIKNKIDNDCAEIDEKFYDNPQYKVFKENLSAYIDNELSDEENIRIKKIAIANPLARKDLENIYAFKQLLQSSFSRTKNSMKNDFVKKTLNKLSIKEDSDNDHQFYKIITVFAGIMTFILVGVINLLNF